MPAFSDSLQPQFDLVPERMAIIETIYFDLSQSLGNLKGLNSDGEIRMSPNKVLNFDLKLSQVVDDSLDGEKEAPSIDYFDFLVKDENQLANVWKESVHLAEISLSDNATNFLLAQRGLDESEYELFPPTNNEYPIKIEWLVGESFNEISWYEQALASAWLSSS